MEELYCIIIIMRFIFIHPRTTQTFQHRLTRQNSAMTSAFNNRTPHFVGGTHNGQL